MQHNRQQMDCLCLEEDVSCHSIGRRTLLLFFGRLWRIFRGIWHILLFFFCLMLVLLQHQVFFFLGDVRLAPDVERVVLVGPEVVPLPGPTGTEVAVHCGDGVSLAAELNVKGPAVRVET